MPVWTVVQTIQNSGSASVCLGCTALHLVMHGCFDARAFSALSLFRSQVFDHGLIAFRQEVSDLADFVLPSKKLDKLQKCFVTGDFT